VSEWCLTCNGDEVVVADFNDMVAGERLRVLGVRIDDERSNTAPRRQHVTSAH